MRVHQQVARSVAASKGARHDSGHTPAPTPRSASNSTTSNAVYDLDGVMMISSSRVHEMEAFVPARGKYHIAAGMARVTPL